MLFKILTTMLILLTLDRLKQFTFPLSLQKRILYFIVFFLLGILAFSQNENKKWYFGNHAGLDFSTTPPTILTGSMYSPEGCSSIADAAGNLLFYTDGIQVWTSTHAIMAGPGGNLHGNPSSCQSGVIVQNPA